MRLFCSASSKVEAEPTPRISLAKVAVLVVGDLDGNARDGGGGRTRSPSALHARAPSSDNSGLNGKNQPPQAGLGLGLGSITSGSLARAASVPLATLQERGPGSGSGSANATAIGVDTPMVVDAVLETPRDDAAVQMMPTGSPDTNPAGIRESRPSEDNTPPASSDSRVDTTASAATDGHRFEHGTAVHDPPQASLLGVDLSRMDDSLLGQEDQDQDQDQDHKDMQADDYVGAGAAMDLEIWEPGDVDGGAVDHHDQDPLSTDMHPNPGHSTSAAIRSRATGRDRALSTNDHRIPCGRNSTESSSGSRLLGGA